MLFKIWASARHFPMRNDAALAGHTIKLLTRRTLKEGGREL